MTGDYELYHGDCLTILPTLAERSIDAVITDPPYGTTACRWDSPIPFAPMWEQLKRLIKPRGAIVLFGSQPFTSALVMSNPWQYRHSWVWEKDKAANILNANRSPLDVVEDIMVFSYLQPQYNPQKLSVKPYNHKNRGVISANFGRNGSNYNPDGYTIYDTAYPRNVLYFAKDDTAHPTQKPLALLEYLVKTYTNPGDTVLDFTMGSGTTGHACANTGRRFIGIEQDAGYFAIAEERIATAYAPLRHMEAAS